MRNGGIFSGISAKDRKAEDFWKQIVDPDLHVEDKSNVGTCSLVHRDHGFGADLAVSAFPKNARTDGSGGVSAAAILRALHGKFDQRNHIAKRTRESGVLDMLLVIENAVFEGDAPFEDVGIK